MGVVLEGLKKLPLEPPTSARKCQVSLTVKDPVKEEQRGRGRLTWNGIRAGEPPMKTHRHPKGWCNRRAWRPKGKASHLGRQGFATGACLRLSLSGNPKGRRK